ncbi:MAG: phosphorylase [bacterium]
MSVGSFERGGLWRRVQEVTRRALAGGALVPIPTTGERVLDGGVEFLVRVATSLKRRDEEREQRDLRGPQDTAAALRPPPNPFLPYDEALFVADVSETHVGLLNKFNVVEHHLLIVTRDFVDQARLMDEADFAALWSCLGEVDGLGFYNGGETAGASQPHKHLQLVPLPFAAQGPRIPLEPAWERAVFARGVGTSPALPFRHALARVEGVAGMPGGEAAALLLERYHLLLAAVGRGAERRSPSARQPGPYNLLLTREWMLVVPRAVERFGAVSLNALAFAGSLFVRDAEQLEALRAAGPMRALCAVVGGG